MKASLRLLLTFVTLPLICLLSCTKADDMYLKPDLAQRFLDGVVSSGNAIDAVQPRGNHVQVSFSDGTKYYIYSLVLGQIGLDGFWYVNGEKTDYLIEVPENDIIKAFIEKTGNTTKGGNNLTGIFEGYKSWSFFFDDNTVIEIVKSIFSYDSDSILKGIAHRGYSAKAPENTLPSFRSAKLRGFNYVETDVRFTSDGIPVLLHDSSIGRTSNGEGAIKDLSLEQVRQFDFGSWKDPSFEGTVIPTLEEFLDLCRKDEIWPYIELKVGTRVQIEQLVSLVDNYGLLDKTTIMSFNGALLKYAHNYNDTVRIGILTYSVKESTINIATSLKGNNNEVVIVASNWEPDTIETCKQYSLPLEVWTVNKVSDIMSMPEYVTGVISNVHHAGMLIHDAQN